MFWVRKRIEILLYLNGKCPLDHQTLNQRSDWNLPNSDFGGCLSMERQPQKPDFRNNPESFHQS